MLIGNIKQNNEYKLNFKLSSVDYSDFKISNVDYSSEILDGNVIYDSSVISYIDFLNDECFKLINNNLKIVSLSGYTWGESINSEVSLPMYWITGLDNGDINYYNPISEWINEFEYKKGDNDFSLYLHPVSGSLRTNEYYVSKNNNGIEFNGGFLQGYFKLFGSNYQVLPTDFSEKTFEFILNKSVSEIKDNPLNKMYPNNKGIFFYMGVRAENKFWYYSKKNENKYKKRTELVLQPNSSPNFKYFRYLYAGNASSGQLTNKFYGGNANSQVIDNTFNLNCGNSNNTYQGLPLNIFDDTPNFISNVKTPNPNFSFLEGLINKYKNLSFIKTNILKTDNKYCFFNNTEKENTYTTDTWNGEDITIYNSKKNNNLNYYKIFNQTNSGFTTDSINDDIIYDNTINVENDIINNCIGFRITEDNKIGYRIILKDVNDVNDSGYTINEEYSDTLDFSGDVHVVVKTKKLINSNIKIYFYVNSVLVLSSSELPEINFYNLNEIKEKQCGVPYNISLGGGTLGLYESFLGNDLSDVGFNNQKFWVDNILPIEENFCGTFIGSMKMFKIYNEPLTYDKIKNNFNFINNNAKKY